MNVATGMLAAELSISLNDAFPRLRAHAFQSGIVPRDVGSAPVGWSHVASAMVEAGFRAVHAFPLRLAEQTLTALDDRVHVGHAVGVIEPRQARRHLLPVRATHSNEAGSLAAP